MIINLIQKSIIVSLLFLSSSLSNAIRTLPQTPARTFEYIEAPTYVNSNQCKNPLQRTPLPICDPSLIHVAMTVDSKYLRGSIAAVHSVLKHSTCPENIWFHFVTSISTSLEIERVIESTFPNLRFQIYPFENEEKVKRLISSSIRPALENPLNYARIYLSEILHACITRVVYVDSDTILVDDIEKLYSTTLTGSKLIAAPKYCNANFASYFNPSFWTDPALSRVFEGKPACYFNTGVMVMDLQKWRMGDYTEKIEKWMEIHKEKRIYELGSLPPFMLVFGGEIEGVDHRWNQHGLGGDNVVNSCRSLHPGPVSLLHWSGKGKPWVRLDEGRPCPVDYLWAPYDLHGVGRVLEQ